MAEKVLNNLKTTGWQNLNEFYREQKLKAEEEKIFEIKDLRKGGFYWIKNEILEKIGPVTGPYGVAVYNVLAYFCDGYGRKSFPSVRKIAQMLGISHTTVVEALEKLEALGVIRIEKIPGKTNIYYLIDPEKRGVPPRGMGVPRRGTGVPPRGTEQYPITIPNNKNNIYSLKVEKNK
jgi:biotin operon repressor